MSSRNKAQRITPTNIIVRYRAKEYDTDNYPTDPISACTSALVGDFTTMVMAAADIPRDIFKAAVGPPRSKSTENIAIEDSNHEASKAGVTSADALEHTGSDVTSVLTHDLTPSPSNSSSRDLTAITSITSTTSRHSDARTTSSSAPSQRRSRHSTITGMGTSGITNQQLERVLDGGKGINNIISTGIKSPMNFCLGIARGFRNAPSLYNDDTVRPVEKVTGFGSGLKVAGKEFGLGLYDGITGLVTQPLRGAEKEGGAGLLKGFGKGIGGLILKPSAGK